MSQADIKTSDCTVDKQGVATDKVYEAPRITHREPLEAVATACTGGTAKGNPADCPTGPINS